MMQKTRWMLTVLTLSLLSGLVLWNAGNTVKANVGAPIPPAMKRQDKSSAQVPGVKFRSQGKNAIPGHYIIVLDEEVTGKEGEFSRAPVVAVQVARAYRGKLKHVYKHVLNGFSAELSKEDARKLSEDPRVKYVEEDAEVHLADTQASPPSWGLSRVSGRQLDLNKTYSYPATAGEGVDVYVMDSGIYPNHPDFGGRASAALILVTQEPPVDFSGHGTHVAGIIGSTTYGIAKKANILSIKALNRFGTGLMSDILLGLEYVTTHVRPGKTVLNMSIAGPQSVAVNVAVSAAYNAGVVVIVAAGNNGMDACQFSPASAPNAFAVGATDRADIFPTWSNHGSCVALFAPGVDIVSTWIPVPPAGATVPPEWFNNPTVTLSGTSQAAPHVAGVAALIMGQSDFRTPAEVYRILKQSATQGVIQGLDALSPNLLLFNDENSRYTPPTLASQTVTRTAGTSATRSIIAFANDAEDAEPTLVITASPINGTGVTVSNFNVDDFGNVTANVEAACNATPATFTLRVSDSSSLIAETTLSVDVTPDVTAPNTSLTSVPSVLSGANVSFGFTGSDACGVSSFECKLDSGGWTACGNSQNYSGLANGAHTFQVRAKDAAGNVDPTPASHIWQVFTASCGTTLNPVTLVQPQIGMPYAQALSASPAGNYSFSLLAGTLPPGLQLVSVFGLDALTGLPTTPGTYNFTLKAKKNNSTCEGARSFTVTITPTVAPLLNCVVRNANGTYTAKFGYDNTTGAAVTIPVGANNYFTPGNQNRGQVTTFQPGRVNTAFSVTFTANGNNLGVWMLKGPDGVLRPVNITTVTLGCP